MHSRWGYRAGYCWRVVLGRIYVELLHRGGCRRSHWRSILPRSQSIESRANEVGPRRIGEALWFFIVEREWEGWYLTTRWSGPGSIVGRVWPRHGGHGRPLNSVVRQHSWIHFPSRP